MPPRDYAVSAADLLTILQLQIATSQIYTPVAIDLSAFEGPIPLILPVSAFANGGPTPEIWQLTLGVATGGSVTFGGNEFAFDATAEEVHDIILASLEASFPSLDLTAEDLIVTGPDLPEGPLLIEFTGPLAGYVIPPPPVNTDDLVTEDAETVALTEEQTGDPTTASLLVHFLTGPSDDFEGDPDSFEEFGTPLSITAEGTYLVRIPKPDVGRYLAVSFEFGGPEGRSVAVGVLALAQRSIA